MGGYQIIKRKMKKTSKKISTGMIVSLLTIGMVIAGLAAYYASIQVTVNIDQPITVNGENIPYEDPMSVDCTAGDFCISDVLSVENSNNEGKDITMTTTECDEADIYVLGKLDLTTKDENWTETSDLTASLYFTLVNNEFKYLVQTNEDLSDYVVVYYPDADGNPGSWNIDEAIEIGAVTEEWTPSSLNEGLPISSDYNEEAKIWLIPEEDWTAKSWNPSVWLFEHNLIKYYKNSEGIVEVPAEGGIEFYLGFDVDEMAYDSCLTTLTIDTI